MRGQFWVSISFRRGLGLLMSTGLTRSLWTSAEAVHSLWIHLPISTFRRVRSESKIVATSSSATSPSPTQPSTRYCVRNWRKDVLTQTAYKSEENSQGSDPKVSSRDLIHDHHLRAGREPKARCAGVLLHWSSQNMCQSEECSS